MSTTIQVIVQLVPVSMYGYVYFKSKKLINSKVIDKENRKKYKKKFNRNLAEMFAPVFIVIGIITFYQPWPNSNDSYINFMYIGKIVLAALSVVNGIFSYLLFTSSVNDLKSLTEQEIIDKL